MSKDNVISLPTPESSPRDSLNELLKVGACGLLKQAVEEELREFLGNFETNLLPDGRRAVVRNGYLPPREVQTGIGNVGVQVPKVRDRSGSGLKFNSKLLPPYLRRSRSMEEVIPWLYLKGVSTGSFQEALSALLGEEAKGLSCTSISRLKGVWEQEYEQWNNRSLHGKRYVYIWADGVYFNVRLEDARQCLLVVIGVDEYGKKEFLAIEDGYRESEQSWTEVLLGLQELGLKESPKLAIGDGALGFWKALSKIHPETRQQRCWVHKTANVLNKLPKSIQAKAKSDIHQIWMSGSRDAAHKAFDAFEEKYTLKYEKAVECLVKDRDQLLAFYDFPAEHWKHIRTSNPVESTFATIRLRTTKTRGCISRKSGLTLVYKLAMSSQGSWRRLYGFKRLGELIQGVKFINGVREEEALSKIAA